jgi:hypothetical protein
MPHCLLYPRRLCGQSPKSGERVGVLPSEQNQRRRPIVRLAAPLFPPLECPRIDANSVRERRSRHAETRPSALDDLSIDARERQTLHAVRSQRNTSPTMRAHGCRAVSSAVTEPTRAWHDSAGLREFRQEQLKREQFTVFEILVHMTRERRRLGKFHQG